MTDPEPKDDEPKKFPITGIARTVIAYDNSGFKNFRILTLHLVDGVVVQCERSDPYANFEVISRLELANELGILNLNNKWSEGKILNK